MDIALLRLVSLMEAIVEVDRLVLWFCLSRIWFSWAVGGVVLAVWMTN